MSQEPLVSAIIIFLNTEEFIEEAIESVVAQTYKNWELVLVDDGSSDGSTLIAKSYAQQYPEKIRYCEHEGHQNLGTSASRNLGFARSKGEYIAYLDADDVWLPNKLKQQIAILEAHPEAGLVYGRTQYWFSWRKGTKPSQIDCLTKALPIAVDQVVKPAMMPLLLYLGDQHIYPDPCSVLVRRWVFERVGGFEESFRVFYEDIVFFTKIFLAGIPAYISSACWDRYRQHDQSSWAVEKKKALYCPPWNPHPTWVGYMQWLESYLLAQKIEDANLWKALQRNLWPSQHPILSSLYWNLVLRPILISTSIARRILPARLRHWIWVPSQNLLLLFARISYPTK